MQGSPKLNRICTISCTCGQDELPDMHVAMAPIGDQGMDKWGKRGREWEVPQTSKNSVDEWEQSKYYATI